MLNKGKFMPVSNIQMVQANEFLGGLKSTSINDYIEQMRQQYSTIKGNIDLVQKAVQIRAVHDFVTELMQHYQLVNIQSYDTLFRMEKAQPTPLQALSYVYADIVADLHLSKGDIDLFAVTVDFYMQSLNLKKVVKIKSKVDHATHETIMGIWDKCLNKYIPQQSALTA